MDVCLLYYFLVLAEEGNMESAASRLGMPIATLADHLSVLEDELGLVLFSHDISGMVVLTPAGSAFLPYVRKIVEEVEAAKREIDLIGRLSSRTRRWARLFRLSQDTPTI